ncbi:putative disease resistance protein At4g10780 [Jatropha curcas]|uniref:putative disease resistance protein At4g10780 n=1 Tax=Jatropha curcas TaxID=180498 RepID=UPI001895D28D|nr:putative disease resistance protein At4g10780 [Jatropha curcas]
MGGVGKTTLLNQINNKFASTTHNFDVVIWVVVSKDLKPDKIQEDIWKKVGFFDETWAKKIPSEKAEDIFYRLSRKKFVLFLDDLWQKVDLRDIGVPLDSIHDAFLQNMQEKVGDIPPNILPLATDVVKKCGGLPLALITIGHAMAGKDAVQEWEHALEVLRSYASSLQGMEDEVFQDMEVEVFAILKFSYDSLHSEKVKSCFLYCSLFPEDFEILKDDLVHYFVLEMGIDLLFTCSDMPVEKMEKYVKSMDVCRDMTFVD